MDYQTAGDLVSSSRKNNKAKGVKTNFAVHFLTKIIQTTFQKDYFLHNNYYNSYTFNGTI